MEDKKNGVYQYQVKKIRPSREKEKQKWLTQTPEYKGKNYHTCLWDEQVKKGLHVGS